MAGHSPFSQGYAGISSVNACGAGFVDLGPVGVTGETTHTADSVLLNVTSTLDQPASDESWGIDDVVIRVR